MSRAAVGRRPVPSPGDLSADPSAGPSADAAATVDADGAGTAEWSVWSTTARLVVTDPAALPAARGIAEDVLAGVDVVASRFRPDAEIVALGGDAGRPVPVSPLLARLVRAALEAAEASDGAVDPTLGADLRAAGYDRDIASLPPPPAAGAAAGPLVPGGPAGPTAGGMRLTVRRRHGWRDVVLDDTGPGGPRLTVPAGLTLDLGATAKAWTADEIARRVRDRTGSGVLVGLGGDLATAGPAPDGGWRVEVCDGEGEPGCLVALPAGAAMATSSTIRRVWGHHGRLAHHILDPDTGRPAPPVWRTVSVAASSCLAANTLSTAAVVRGAGADRDLAAQRVCARLVAADRSVRRVGGWPR